MVIVCWVEDSEVNAAQRDDITPFDFDIFCLCRCNSIEKMLIDRSCMRLAIGDNLRDWKTLGRVAIM